MKQSKLKIYLVSDVNAVEHFDHIFGEFEDFYVEILESNRLIVDLKQPSINIIFLSNINSTVVEQTLAIKNPRAELFYFLVNEYAISSVAKLARRGFNKIFVLPDDMKEFKESIMTEVKVFNPGFQGFYKKLTEDEYTFKSIIGSSESNALKINKIINAAKSSINFIIQGEIGLGKSRLARAIHNYSNMEKFVEVIPPYSEEGFFSLQVEQSDKTEYLDEIPDHKISTFLGNSTMIVKNINELSKHFQKRIVRFLNTYEANYRIISTSTENLENKIFKGEFLDELYYRLNGTYIELNPIRFRPDELQHLFNHLVNLNSKKLNKRITKIEPDVFEFVGTYPWLGNIQELENAIVNALAFSDNNVLSLTDFANIIVKNTAKENFVVRTTDVLPNTVFLEVDFLTTTLDELNKKYAEVVLRKFENNKSKVADILGITRPTLKKLVD